ncbi:fimbrial protein [Klebsiella oxytoca]|uniref:fimbrial protein n=1 Tax=Klebsiella oxytoca TaxID=571 RepID=UPI000D528747|nr:fimbrial protein [Klebsiella oxytoca]
MKLKALAFAVTAVVGGMNAASAVDGTINFTGTVSESGCSVNSVAGVGSIEGAVDFGQVNKSTLTKGDGTGTVPTPFSIELTDCAASVKPKIMFNGSAVPDANADGLFMSGVTGVGIRIKDANADTTYRPGEYKANSGFSSLSSTVKTATGNFIAFLQATQTEVGNGTVDASVTFTMDYSGT